MTQELRVNFLNWRPDQEDVNTDGLTVADNVIHEPEGYKSVHLQTSGGFATTGGLAASSATILSCVAKPVGSQGDLFCAWVAASPANFNTIHVGVNGVTSGSATTAFPPNSAATTRAFAITALDVVEFNDRIHFLVRADPDSGIALSFHGYMDFA